MKLPKLNQKGITHILAPLFFIVVFAAVGSYVILKSHAASVKSTRQVGGYVYRDGSPVSGAFVYWGNYGANQTHTDATGHYGFYTSAKKVSVSAFYEVNTCLLLSSKSANVSTQVGVTHVNFKLTISQLDCYVQGRVKDHGKSVGNAVVALQNKDTYTSSTQKTDNTGFYSFPIALKASYAISASLKDGCKIFSSDTTSFTVSKENLKLVPETGEVLPLEIDLNHTALTC